MYNLISLDILKPLYSFLSYKSIKTIKYKFIITTLKATQKINTPSIKQTLLKKKICHATTSFVRSFVPLFFPKTSNYAREVCLHIHKPSAAAVSASAYAARKPEEKNYAHRHTQRQILRTTYTPKLPAITSTPSLFLTCILRSLKKKKICISNRSPIPRKTNIVAARDPLMVKINITTSRTLRGT